MAEEISIFIRPNENYTYKTPFQTINIVQMSEDEQDDPDPITPGKEPEGPLLIAFSTDGTNYTNFSEIEWKTDKENFMAGMILTTGGFAFTKGAPEPGQIIYYHNITKNKIYFKTKYNKIIELNTIDGGIYFKRYDIDKIIPITREMWNNLPVGQPFDKLNYINKAPINYKTWETTNDLINNTMNICYIPSTDELYFAPASETPETTPKYFYNYYIEDAYFPAAIFYTEISDYSGIEILGFKTKITGASTIFNMTHE